MNAEKIQQSLNVNLSSYRITGLKSDTWSGVFIVKLGPLWQMTKTNRWYQIKKE